MSIAFSEILGLAATGAGVLLSLGLLVLLKVFAATPLLEAPVRRGKVNFLLAGGVVFFYIGAEMLLLQIMAACGMVGAGKGAAGPAREVILQAADGGVKIVMCVLLILLLHRLVAGGLRGWGLALNQILRGIGYGLAALAVIYPLLVMLNIAVEWVLEQFGKGIVEHQTFDLLKDRLGEGQVTILILAAAVVAPLFEEMFFRGIVQTAFVQRGWGFWPADERPEARGFEVQGMEYAGAALVAEEKKSWRPGAAQRWAAILITAFLFAGIHFSPTNFPVLFLLGIALGYVYERTGNLWAAITLHALFNAVNLSEFFLNR